MPLARKCAVLGAGGFIGTNLCLVLGRLGFQVTAIGRRSHAWSPEILGLDWVEADFVDAATIADAISGHEIVFHLLGGSVPGQSNDDPVSDVMASLVPSLQLIQACSAQRIRRLVFVSSGGTVYGPTGPGMVAETAATNPITAYGINKLAVEKYLGLFRHLHGLDAIVLRLANPYGPYQHRRRAQGLVGTLLAKALAGERIEIWGDGSVVRDYIHIDDVISALVSTIDYRGRQHVFNIGSGQGRTVRDVVADVCAITLTSLNRVTYHPGRPADVPFNILDCTLAREELNWQARVGWQEGLSSTIDWLKQRS